MEKYDIMWNDQISPILNPLKIKKKLNFTILNYILNYILHPKLYMFIQVNSKLNIKVQSVTRVIAYGAKRAFKKFKVQSVI